MPNSAQFVGERLDLLARDRIGDAELEADGRDVVIHRRDRELGAAHATTVHAQPVERLGRRHLVDEMEVDVEEVGLARRMVDDVLLPQLLAQRLCHLLPSRSLPVPALSVRHCLNI